MDLRAGGFPLKISLEIFFGNIFGGAHGHVGGPARARLEVFRPRTHHSFSEYLLEDTLSKLLQDNH